MNEHEICRMLEQSVPEVPEQFHQAMEETLACIVREERPQPVVRMRRALALAAAIALLLATAAYAVYRFTTFDVLSFLTGQNPVNAGEIMSASLHQETVNGVDVTIREAGYDGRMLLIQYSYRLPDENPPMDPYECESMVFDRGVGWWTDNFWIDGVNMDMFAGSGSELTGGAPGEVIHTEYWRLDEGNVKLSGEVEIALPIGAKPDTSRYFPRKDHPEWFNADGSMKKPDQGLVTFRLNTGDTLSRVLTEAPNLPTTNELGTFRVSEAAFSPLMTYLTLAIAPDPAALERYKAEHGEGLYDDEGALAWPYDASDVHGGWVHSLSLVDADGNELFPGHYGVSMLGREQAEFLYPHIEHLPDELWLAPVENGQARMEDGVRVR